MDPAPPNIFGILASGRLVQTNFTQLGTKQFLINIPEAHTINYISVFMTGVVPFPEGLSGLIYFSWPDPNAPPNWQLLGFISNDKPSSVFKVSKFRGKFETPETSTTGLLSFDQQNISHVAQIGISVEPVEVVKQQMEIIDKTDSNQSSFIEFTHKMVQNLYNYSSSFLVTRGQLGGSNPDEYYIPLSVINSWYHNFNRRLAFNPYFWKS